MYPHLHVESWRSNDTLGCNKWRQESGDEDGSSWFQEVEHVRKLKKRKDESLFWGIMRLKWGIYIVCEIPTPRRRRSVTMPYPRNCHQIGGNAVTNAGDLRLLRYRSVEHSSWVMPVCSAFMCCFHISQTQETFRQGSEAVFNGAQGLLGVITYRSVLTIQPTV